ncbi:MAG: hypothetical protein IJU50_06810 [Lachnospiraceae bacterium]|nr:hypothetical protein [Lachnospiraceae bacterium]
MPAEKASGHCGIRAGSTPLTARKMDLQRWAACVIFKNRQKDVADRRLTQFRLIVNKKSNRILGRGGYFFAFMMAMTSVITIIFNTQFDHYIFPHRYPIQGMHHAAIHAKFNTV